jgi:hypothetical protein
MEKDLVLKLEVTHLVFALFIADYTKARHLARCGELVSHVKGLTLIENRW